ncbi:MAG: hypothetical protein Kow0092_31980 [Deferrisomatales bacterium]
MSVPATYPKRLCAILVILILGGATIAGAQSTAPPVPPYIDYQGQVLDAAGQPAAGPVDIEVGLFNGATGGLELYHESHPATPLVDGVFNLLIGTGIPTPGSYGFNPDLFSHPPLYLEVTIDGETLTPRQPLASVGHAMTAWAADVAGDASTLWGRPPEDYDQSAHVGRMDNPHGVTAAQAEADPAGAAAGVQANLDAHRANGAAHHPRYTDGEAVTAMGAQADTNPLNHTKTASFTDLTDQIAEAQVPRTIARIVEVVWNNANFHNSLPAGFADDVDDVGLTSESDPQVGSLTTGKIPRWDGTELVDGSLYDVGGKIGAGTNDPQDDVDILGSFRVHPRSHYYVRDRQDVAVTSPRCDCDLDANVPDCGEAFFGDTSYASGCSDWYEPASGVGVTSDHYVRRLPTPLSLHVDPLAGTLETQTELRVSSGEPTLLLRDTNGGPDRPRVRFENNGTVAFEGDDTGDQYYNFYATFQHTRTNSAHLRTYGAATGSWGKYTEVSHDGVNGKVATDAGDLVLAPAGSVKVDKSVTFPDGTRQTTAYRGFPRPNYDSGWVAYSGSELVLDHNLGGDPDNYVVDLTFKRGNNVNNRGIGMDTMVVNGFSEYPGNLSQEGTFWKWLDATSITVAFSPNWNSGIDHVRVRIWVYQ